MKFVIDYQITHVAVQILSPYVHIEQPTPGWVQVRRGPGFEGDRPGAAAAHRCAQVALDPTSEETLVETL